MIQAKSFKSKKESNTEFSEENKSNVINKTTYCYNVISLGTKYLSAIERQRIIELRKLRKLIEDNLFKYPYRPLGCASCHRKCS